MIKRVYARLNNQEIEFLKTSDSKWEVIVPKINEGRYYIDLYAQDYAGNTSFIATALFVVDANCTCVEFSILNDCLILENDKYNNIFNLKNYELEVVECKCLN